jgi:ABC-type amino acid transport substrate-binding protein
MRLSVLFFILGVVFFSSNLIAQEIIRSSVSEELVDGLHAKYLRNIAKHMNMEIEIIPMPFARRLRELREGNLDLLIGLQQGEEDQDEVVYIKPSYETLRHTFFIRNGNIDMLRSFKDLKSLSLGVTQHAKYFELYSQDPNLIMVPVSTVRQKIDLLMKGRINAFIHFQESAIPLISQMDLQNDIVLADYQPIEVNSYYVTISRNSPLFDRKKLFQSAVRKALANKEFASMRKEHYASQF